MKTYQKFFFTFLVVAIILTFTTVAALAQENSENEAEAVFNPSEKLRQVGAQAGFNSSEGVSLPRTIGRIIQAFLSFLGIIFMGYIIYGGSLWITARGEEEKITRAKAIIRGSVIGIIIVFSAWAITAFILFNLVRGTGFGVAAG